MSSGAPSVIQEETRALNLVGLDQWNWAVCSAPLRCGMDRATADPETLGLSSFLGMGRRGSLLLFILLLLCYSSMCPGSRKRRPDVTQGWPWRYLDRTQMPGRYCSSVRTGRGDVRIPPTHTKKNLCRTSVNRKKH